MTPEDIFPTGNDSIEVQDLNIRKGTIAAFIQNTLALEHETNPGQRAKAKADILDLLPALRALHVFDVFEVRNTEVRSLLTGNSQTASTLSQPQA